MVASAQAEAQSWSLTGSLNTPRYGHTATLLGNGKVLVAGGWSAGANNLKTAELYNPQTGAWSVTGNLNTPRSGPTATLLRDGKVLVVGGYFASGNFDFLNSAELYDPETGTWSLTGSLHAPPYTYTATLLQNGKVLVAGEFIGANRLSVIAAELYDPETGTWSSVGRLDRSSRVWHSATLLPDGSVLIAGGNDGDGYFFNVIYDTVELYNPNTGTWSSTGYLNIPLWGHTATLLPDGKVLVVGGIGRSGDLVGSELYDPSTGTWSFTSNPNTPRIAHTATLLADGKVLIVGGYANDLGSSTITLGSAELGSNFAAVPPTIGAQ